MRLDFRAPTPARTDRRQWLRKAGAACMALLGARSGFAGLAAAEGQVMTVLGPISPAAFGRALTHEHVFVDFGGAEHVQPDSYNLDGAFRSALPALRRVSALGCRGFVDCTPAYLGRVPRLLQRLARATDLHIVTNTGYYGAGKDRFVPRHAVAESAQALADRWTAEWRTGIDGTGIRPGFIKTGVDSGPLSLMDRKLLQAAARSHLLTGLTIASHTPDTRAAQEQLSVLRDEGVAPDAFIWVHAQNDWQADSRIAAAKGGAWIALDNVAPATLDQCVERIDALKRAGALNRVLVSHDAGWYDPALPGGGTFRPFDTVFTALVPALRRAGWRPSELRDLLVANPAAAFTVRVRGRAHAG